MGIADEVPMNDERKALEDRAFKLLMNLVAQRGVAALDEIERVVTRFGSAPPGTESGQEAGRR